MVGEGVEKLSSCRGNSFGSARKTRAGTTVRYLRRSDSDVGNNGRLLVLFGLLWALAEDEEEPNEDDEAR